MNKLVEIAKAWMAAANPSPAQKALAEYRASVCSQCPHNIYTEMVNMYVCGKCGCPLSKKIFSPLPGPQACPDQRWER